MSFVSRLLTVQLVLGDVSSGVPTPFQGANNQTGNTLTISGLRVWATIVASGPNQNGTAEITIFGMTFDQMMSASTFSKWPSVQTNARVFLYAGDASGMSLAFSGTIKESTADFNAQPDVAFHITAFSALAAQMTPLPPTSVKGSVSAASLIQSITGQINPPMSFENNSNVQVQVSNPHYSGSAADQIRAICADYQINLCIENGTTVAIWPKGQVREKLGSTAQGISISPATGMIGYPTFGQNKVTVKSLYNPAVFIGMQISISGSIIQPANGTWMLYAINHDLQSMSPNGPWFSTLTMNPPQVGTPN